MAAQGSGGAGNIVRMQVMLKVMGDCQLSQMQQMLAISGNLGKPLILTHSGMNELPHTIYWKILILILGMSGYVI